MGKETLAEFVGTNRGEVLLRAREKMAKRVRPPTDSNVERGIPRFIDDVVTELGGTSMTGEIRSDAARHGGDLFRDGAAVGEVVHAYGNVCQAITDLVVERQASIDAMEFRTLNRLLDDAIASAVSEYARHQRSDDALNPSMTLRNLVETALNGFEALQSGRVGVGGSTGDLVHRCLLGIREGLRGEPM